MHDIQAGVYLIIYKLLYEQNISIENVYFSSVCLICN